MRLALAAVVIAMMATTPSYAARVTSDASAIAPKSQGSGAKLAYKVCRKVGSAYVCN